MNLAQLKHNTKLQKLCRKEDITFLGLFGSYSRGEQKPDSDVDVLIEYRDIKSLFDLARIQIELEKLLGKEVDLVVKRNIKPALKPYIFSDLIKIYEEECRS